MLQFCLSLTVGYIWCCFVLHLSLNPTVGLDTWCCFVQLDLHLSVHCGVDVGLYTPSVVLFYI